MDGWADTSDGRTDRRTDGRTDGRTKRRMNGRLTDGRTDGRTTDERTTDGRTNRRTDGWTDLAEQTLLTDRHMKLRTKYSVNFVSVCQNCAKFLSYKKYSLIIYNIDVILDRFRSVRLVYTCQIVGTQTHPCTKAHPPIYTREHDEDR